MFMPRVMPCLCVDLVGVWPNASLRLGFYTWHSSSHGILEKKICSCDFWCVDFLGCYSEWVSPVQVVPKKGGIMVVRNEKNALIPQRTVTGWRMCIDYRKLNKATKKDHFPLPFIDEMLECLMNHSFFCFLDGYFRYTKSWSTLMTKVRLLSHAHMELMHTDECCSGCAML